MHLVSVTDLGAEVDGRWLFSDAAFGLRVGDRVGVVGPNGAGKTTLLRILAGDREPDAGEVVLRRNTKIVWLPQEPSWPDGPAVDVVTAGAPELIAAHDAEAILDRVGIDPAMPTNAMSGGQRRRVALARTLAQPSDLLILDEPTNHLDIDAIDWLEAELVRRQTAVVMVTHDRYLLERAVNRMLDLAPTGQAARPGATTATVTWHEGSYSSLLEARQRRAAHDQRTVARARGLLTKEVAWLRRQPKARTSKPKFRIEQAEALREMTRTDPDVAPLELGTGRRRLGKQAIEIADVTVTRGDRIVLDDVALTIGPGERVGIVGPNGAGKTTLVEVLIGLRPPDQGSVRIGSTVEIGYYPQLASVPADRATVLDTICSIAAHIPLANGETLPAARLAERFGFPASLQHTVVADLSGGERRRLALLHVLVASPNVLVLDEPTNDLDLDTLAVLEDHLDGFGGCLIVASHDRFVLDRLTDRIIAVGDGRLSHHQDYDSARSARADAGSRAGTSAPGGGRSDAKANQQRQQARKRRRSAEERLNRLEQQRSDVLGSMAAAALDPGQIRRLQPELDSLNERVADAETAWLEATDEEERTSS